MNARSFLYKCYKSRENFLSFFYYIIDKKNDAMYNMQCIDDTALFAQWHPRYALLNPTYP